MTKTEFLTRLGAELKARKVADRDDILGEYSRHFDYKLADGYSEEEIAARLGSPEELAAQFESEAPEKSEKHGGGARSAVTWTGLVFLDIFVLSFFLLFACWVLVVACAAVSSGLIALCLLIPFDMQPYVSLPEMPYWCGAVYALALAALAVLAWVGCRYFAALLAQLWRAYFRFHRNASAAAAGRPVLPPLPCVPQFAPERKRRIRRVLLVSLIAFVVFAAAAMVTSMLTAGAVEYWHVWGWFMWGGAVRVGTQCLCPLLLCLAGLDGARALKTA